MKRLFLMALAIILMLGMATPAFATPATNAPPAIPRTAAGRDQRIANVQENFSVSIDFLIGANIEDEHIFLDNLEQSLNLMGPRFVNLLAQRFDHVNRNLAGGGSASSRIPIAAIVVQNSPRLGGASHHGGIVFQPSTRLADIPLWIYFHEFGHLLDFAVSYVNTPLGYVLAENRTGDHRLLYELGASVPIHNSTVALEAYADIFAELMLNRNLGSHLDSRIQWNNTHRRIVFNDIQNFAGNGSRATQRAANFLNIELPAAS